MHAPAAARPWRPEVHRRRAVEEDGRRLHGVGQHVFRHGVRLPRGHVRGRVEGGPRRPLPARVVHDRDEVPCVGAAERRGGARLLGRVARAARRRLRRLLPAPQPRGQAHRQVRRIRAVGLLRPEEGRGEDSLSGLFLHDSADVLDALLEEHPRWISSNFR